MKSITLRVFLGLLVVVAGLGTCLLAAEPSSRAKLRIVTLGDSITKGARSGVAVHETFAAILEAELKKTGRAVEVLNVGIGGERTDGALARLDRDVIAKQPNFVTIRYGTNDSYVDKGKTEPRLTRDEYRANLKQIVERLKAANILNVLRAESR